MDKKQNASTSNEDGGSDTEYDIYCSLCKTGFSGTVPFRQHLNGSKHKKAETKQYMKEKYGEEYLKALDKMKNSDGSTSNDSTGPIVAENSDGSDALILTCNVCKKVCTGHIPYKLHLASKQHAKQMKKLQLIGNLPNDAQEGSKEDSNPVYDVLPQLKPYATCSTCKKSFSGPESFTQHLDSMTHQKELQKQQLLKNMKQGGVLTQNEDENSPDKGIIACTACEKNFSGPIPYQVHLLSDIHKHKAEHLLLLAKVKDMMLTDDDGAIHCAECGKVFSGPKPLYEHITGPAHSKQKKKDDLAKDLLTKYPEFMKESTKLEKEEQDPDSDVDLLICTICHKCFSGLENASQHFRSKKHSKAKAEKCLVEKIKQKNKDVAQKVKQPHANSNMTNGAGHSSSAAMMPKSESAINAKANEKEQKNSACQDDFELI